MQMYRVKFARKISAASVDVGDVIVCSNSQEAAIAAVALMLDLPVSDTEFEAHRVKPSFYQISRRTIDNSLSAVGAQTVNAAAACRATFPGVTESRQDRVWFALSVTADIHAPDENEAIAMLSRSIGREIAGTKQKGSTRNLDIVCERAALRPRTAAVDQNALYTFRRIFQGGDTRT
jgi:hypothetical protein